MTVHVLVNGHGFEAFPDSGTWGACAPTCGLHIETSTQRRPSGDFRLGGKNHNPVWMAAVARNLVSRSPIVAATVSRRERRAR